MRGSLAALGVRATKGFKKPSLLVLLLLSVSMGGILSSVLFSTPVLAAAYSLSITTDSSISLSFPSNSNTTISSSNIRVTTNCRAGYDLTLSASIPDNNLYRSGDSANNTSGTYFSPSNGTVALSNATNTWGYLLSPTFPTDSNIFLPVPDSNSSPAILKTASGTASQTDIDDTFPIYYGANADTTLTSGTYKMDEDSTTHENGTLIYYLTASPTCADSLDITFVENAGSDTVTNFPSGSENILDIVNRTLTLSSKKPAREGYVFKEWNTVADGTGSYYQPGAVINIGGGEGELSGAVDLYAIWVEECASATICYDGNHADAGAMSDQASTAGTKVALIASNFSRAGYGFAGWNTAPDGSGVQYGPNQFYTLPSSGGVNLFAQWIKSSGTLQTWDGASNMNVGDVIALRDNRDNEVYTVAKLADNNVWITENLRLVPRTANINEYNTNNPTSDFLSAYPYSSSSNMCSSDDVTCVDTVRYNTNDINRNLTPAPDTNDNASSWYSYGVMYNWYTATAGNGTKSKISGNVSGDLCPAGWHLPTGGSSGEWGAVATAINNSLGGSVTGDEGLRTYPNNFLWSGDYNPYNIAATGRGHQGRIWSATAKDGNNSYRMGYNTSSITATANVYNKWDGFNVRCIYQGGNIPFANVTVNFAGTGVSSLTFTNSNYPTETATPGNPIVSLAENVAYTVTATVGTGYEVGSWATTANGVLNDVTSDPAANPNTYTITGDADLTVTGAQIPSYEVTVNLGTNVKSVSFTHADYGTQTVANVSSGTVNLRRGVSYILSSTYEDGYTLDTWTTSANGTIGSTVLPTTTYSVVGTATLSAAAQEAEEVVYNLVYDTGNGTDGPSTDTATSYQAAHNFAISNTAPIYFGYNFLGWSETSGGSTVDYASGNTITVNSTGATTTKTLYAVYEEVAACPTGKICYYDNGADVLNGGRGTMANQSASSNASVNLIPTNYSREGYGFAGWITTENSTPYGPNANITTGDLSGIGLSLYAKWVKSTGDLQTWNSCDNLSQNEVTALTDLRDDQTYLVSKLGDNHCWITENLRLDPSSADLSNQYTHSPASGFTTAAASSSSSNILCNTADSAACTDQLQYNTNNLDRTLTQAHNANTDASAWYSYGVYYNWFTATAGNGVFNTNSGNVTGDICPAGWHLPTSTSSGEVAALNTAINSGRTNNDSGLRAYPANFLWSGDYNNNKRTNTYVNGRMWTATAYSNNNGYRLGYASSTVTPNGNYNKWDAFAVRCIYDGDTHTYNDVTVTLPQGASSVTFTNPNYGTEIANSGNTTVSLVQGATYTVTANLATGYEFSTWTNGQNSTLGNTNENPTTIVITDDTTLTPVVTEIPSYTVTVSIDSHITGVSFTNATYGTQNVTTNGGTASLRRGVSYTVTATLDTGYEATWSTTANGTLSSTTYNSATYTVSNEATLTVAVQQAPAYQVTVNMDSHVSNVAFYNADLGTQNVSTNGGTASLSRNVAYTVTASFASGYEMDTWSTTANGTLSSTVTNPATYTVTGASILTVASKEIPIMQDYTLSRCSNEAASGNVTLLDSRDNSDYTVRYINGECWMTQNLRIVGTISATGSNFSSNNFNVSEYSLDRSDSSYTNHCDDTNGYNYACAKDSNSTTMGVWYNYYAATAGTIATNSNTTVATEDICPTGWHLPTGNVSVNSDTYKLLGEHTSGYVWPANYPSIAAFNPVHGGYYRLGSLRNSGASKTSWWSATPARSIEETSRYILSYDLQDSSFNVNDTGIRHLGFFVRCVKDKETTIGDVTYMQDVTQGYIANTPTDVTYTLKDKRDETEYTVAKLQDGNLWMTQNLELGEYGTSMNLTDTLSNVSSSGYTLTLDHAEDSTYKGNSNKYGNYYSYYEATAGSDPATSGEDAPYDICPKGWRLPSAGSSDAATTTENEFYAMLNPYITTGTWGSYVWQNTNPPEWTSAPVSLVFSGNYNGGLGLRDQGEKGDWWSATSMGRGPSGQSYTYAANLAVNGDTRIDPRFGSSGGFGYSIRCLMPGS